MLHQFLAKAAPFVLALFCRSASGADKDLISTLYHADFVEYDDSLPWPTGPDGGGSTLELINTATDNSIAGSWAESNVFGGTPGEENSVSP